MKPDFSKSILNPAWVYRNSAQTSVAETFKRIRQEMEAAKVEKVVTPLRRGK